jgi:hypothetical protein
LKDFEKSESKAKEREKREKEKKTVGKIFNYIKEDYKTHMRESEVLRQRQEDRLNDHNLAEMKNNRHFSVRKERKRIRQEYTEDMSKKVKDFYSDMGHHLVTMRKHLKGRPNAIHSQLKNQLNRFYILASSHINKINLHENLKTLHTSIGKHMNNFYNSVKKAQPSHHDSVNNNRLNPSVTITKTGIPTPFGGGRVNTSPSYYNPYHNMGIKTPNRKRKFYL